MKELSIYAQTLIDNRRYRNRTISGKDVGVSEAREWRAAVEAMLVPAYAIHEYRYNHMGDAEQAAPCDQSALYAPLLKVLDLVGEVNGMKLCATNMAEEIIAKAERTRTIDTSNEMAHARNMKSIAYKANKAEPTEAHQAEYDKWVAEVKRLENLPDNCKNHTDAARVTTFIKNVEMLLGDAILKQKAKSAAEVQAELDAKKAARKAHKKAAKAAKAEAK